MAVLEQYKDTFPIEQGEFWFAAGISFNSFALVDGVAVVAISIGDGFELALLGLARMALPRPQFALVSIELGLICRFSTTRGRPVDPGAADRQLVAALPGDPPDRRLRVRLLVQGPEPRPVRADARRLPPALPPRRLSGRAAARLRRRLSTSSRSRARATSRSRPRRSWPAASSRPRPTSGPAWAHVVFGADGIIFFDPFCFDVARLRQHLGRRHDRRLDRRDHDLDLASAPRSTSRARSSTARSPSTSARSRSPSRSATAARSRTTSTSRPSCASTSRRAPGGVGARALVDHRPRLADARSPARRRKDVGDRRRLRREAVRRDQRVRVLGDDDGADRRGARRWGRIRPRTTPARRSASRRWASRRSEPALRLRLLDRNGIDHLPDPAERSRAGPASRVSCATRARSRSPSGGCRRTRTRRRCPAAT